MNTFRSLFYNLFVLLFFSMSRAQSNCEENFNVKEILNVRTYFPENKYQKAVIVLGSTGSGKTTLIEFLMGQKLEAIKVDNKLQCELRSESEKIGSDYTSKTLFPNYYEDDKNSIIYWDLPGYLDTRGAEYDVVNSFLIHKIFESSTEVKMLLVIAESSLETDRGQAFLFPFEIISKMFENSENDKISNSATVVISKAEKYENLAKEVEKFLSSLEKKEYKIKEFFKNILRDGRIKKFSVPKNIGMFTQNNEKFEILEAIKHSEYLYKPKVDLATSPKAQNMLMKFTDCLKTRINENLEILKHLILDKMKPLPLKLVSEFGGILGEAKTKDEILNDFSHFMNFLTAIQILKEDSLISAKVNELNYLYIEILQNYIGKFLVDYKYNIDKAEIIIFFSLSEDLQKIIEEKQSWEQWVAIWIFGPILVTTLYLVYICLPLSVQSHVVSLGKCQALYAIVVFFYTLRRDKSLSIKKN